MAMKSVLSRFKHYKTHNILYRHSRQILSIRTSSTTNLNNILGDELSEEYSIDRGSGISQDDYVGVKGHSSIMDKADFAQARIGDVLEIPYEVTASDFWRDMWQSVFYQQDRIHTSLEYVNSLGNVSGHKIPLPFTCMLYGATTMSHVDDTRNVLDLAFRNCVYERAVFPGDTLTRSFRIRNIRESSNQKNVLIDLQCNMSNQHNELVFKTSKTMFFEKLKLSPELNTLYESSKKGITPQIDVRNTEHSTFKKYLLNKGSKQQQKQYNNSLNTMNGVSIKRIYSNELILHTMQRPIGIEANMNLSMLFKMTHPMLYNTNRSSSPNELYVSGVLLIAMTHSISSKELYEILYEELLDSHIVNKCSPNDCISAMTYIISNNDNKYEYFQECECITIGCKNIDITNDLNGIKVPLSLFRPGIYPRDIEEICNKFIPQLKNKIVVHSYRKLLRAKPKQNTIIPLL